MLPDIRLMIAATLASALVLVCGFGLFAAFRVSHGPVMRVPAAGASLWLVAANPETPSRSITAGEPFNDRFQIGETWAGGAKAISALAYSAPQAAEQPAADIVLPAADYPEQYASTHDASAPEHQPPAPESADAPALSVAAPAPEIAQEAKPDEAAVTSSAADVATADPASGKIPTEQTPVLTRTMEATPAPASAAPVPAALPSVAVEKNSKHVTAGTHRHRAHTLAEVSTFERARSQAEPASQSAQQPPANSRHAKRVSHAAAAWNSGAGGPFVNAPSR